MTTRARKPKVPPAPKGRKRTISVCVSAEQDAVIVEHAAAAELEPSVYLRTLGLCPPTRDPRARAALAAVARTERAIKQRAAEREDEALRLHDTDGLSLAEVGDRFGVTKQRAGKMVAKSRARRALDAQPDPE